VQGFFHPALVGAREERISPLLASVCPPNAALRNAVRKYYFKINLHLLIYQANFDDLGLWGASPSFQATFQLSTPLSIPSPPKQKRTKTTTTHGLYSDKSGTDRTLYS